MKLIRMLIFIFLLYLITEPLVAGKKIILDDWGFSKNWKIVYQFTDGGMDAGNTRFKRFAYVEMFGNAGISLFSGATPDGSKRWIIGMRTYDGGNSWELNNHNLGFLPAKTRLADMQMSGKSTAYALFYTYDNYDTEKSYIMKTVNKGLTWNIDTFDFKQPGILSENLLILPKKESPIVYYDTIYCLFANKIMRSLNSGKNWEAISVYDKSTKAYYTIKKAEKDNSIFIRYRPSYLSFKNYLLRSIDNGRTWEKFTIPDSYNRAVFIDKDTWIYSAMFRHSEQENYDALLKITENGTKVDTLVKKTEFISSYSGHVFYNKDGSIIYEKSNYCLYRSDINGENFKSITNQDEVKEDSYFSIASDSDGNLLLYELTYGVMLKHTPPNSVDSEISFFKTKIYPNPVTADSKIYLSLENDKSRNLNFKIYDISGNLIDESQKMNIPKGYHTIDYLPKNFITGAYFIVIESGGEVIAREKFIVK